jgi:hypothetical protein
VDVLPFDHLGFRKRTMNNQLTDLALIEYVSDDNYMLGAFVVQDSYTGEAVTIEPDHPGPFVLYFDPETCNWMIDQSNYLTWDSEQGQWVS